MDYLATRSPASSASPRTGRSPSSASATSATPWPTTAASRTRGFRVVALLDADPARHRRGGRRASASARSTTSSRSSPSTGVAIGVIATPAAAAQDVCDRAGRRRRHQHPQLRARRARRCPTGVDVRKVDLSIELQILAFHEQRKALAAPGDAADGGARHERPRRRAVPPHRPGRPARAARARRRRRRAKLVARRRGRRARHRGGRALHLQPRSRSTPTSTASTAASTDDHRGCSASAPACDRDELLPHLYVHYEDARRRAPVHVACRPGLDGRRRGPDPRPDARARCAPARRPARVGPALNELFQQALRVGKRAHAETGIDRGSASLVEAALDRAAPTLGAARRACGCSSSAPARWPRWPPPPWPGAAPRDVVVANRTAERGRAARRARTAGRAAPLADAAPRRSPRPTSSSPAPAPPGVVVDRRRWPGRPWPRGGRPQVYIDLALPHDVDPAVADLPGVTLVDLAELGRGPAPTPRSAAEVAEVRRTSSPRRSPPTSPPARRPSVAPTVVALRSHGRPRSSTPSWRRLDAPAARPRRGRRAPRSRQAVRRVVDKLLHTPDRAGQGAGRRGRRRRLRRGAARAVRPRPRRDVDAVSARPPERGGRPMTRVLRLGTRRTALATTQSELGRRPAARASATTVELVEVTTEGDVDRSAPLATLGGTGVFVARPARRPARGRGRPRRALAQGPARPRPTPRHRARRRARCARTRATRSSPATASPSASCPPAPRVGTGLAAPGRPAARARPRPGRRRHPRQRRHPARQGRRRASSTPSCSPAPGWPGSAGSTRSPRCSTRCRCCPPPARARWRSSAAPTTPTRGTVVAALDDADTRACRRPPSARCSPTLEAGCSAPVGALAEVVEGDDGAELWLRAVVAVARRRGRPSRRSARRPDVADAAEPSGAASPTGMLDDGAADLDVATPVTTAAARTTATQRSVHREPRSRGDQPRATARDPRRASPSSAPAPATRAC